LRKTNHDSIAKQAQWIPWYRKKEEDQKTLEKISAQRYVDSRFNILYAT